MITLDSLPVQGTAQRLLVVQELDSQVARVLFFLTRPTDTHHLPDHLPGKGGPGVHKCLTAW